MRTCVPRLTLAAVVAYAGSGCGDSVVRPRFTEDEINARAVRVAAWGEGSGAIRAVPYIDCSYADGQTQGTCETEVPPGTMLTFQAFPADTASNGIAFGGWAGACGGAEGLTCTLQVDAFDLDVSAGFPGVTRLFGKVYRPDGEGGLGNLFVGFTVNDTLRGTIPVSGEGVFDAELVGTYRGAASMHLTVETVDGRPEAFYPAFREVRIWDLADPIQWVVAPRAWSISEGTFVGQRVPIRLGTAMAEEPAFYTTTGQSLAGRFWEFQVQSVTLDRLPLSLAVDRANAGALVTGGDVDRYWRRVAELEAAIGRTLFIRVADPAAADVVVRVQPGGCGPATACANIVNGDPYLDRGGEIIHHSVEQFRGDRGIVVHELSHVLGMGHTCGWTSVMYVSPGECGTSGAPSDVLTATDVAHIQLALRVNSLQKAHGMDPFGGGLMAAWNGQRVLVDGLAPWLPPGCGPCGGS